MERRTRALSVVGVVVVVALAFSVTYPFAMDEGSELPGQGATPSFTSTFAFEGEITADGTLSQRRHVEFVVDDNEALERVRDDPMVDDRAVDTVRYADADEAWTASRMTTNDSETMEAWIDGADESNVVNRDADGDEYVLVTASEGSEDVDALVGDFYADSVAAPAVSYPGYERRGEGTFAGRSVEMYEPQDGWYESAGAFDPFDAYRVVDADGELYVDAETGAVLYADLSYTLVDASNYAEYLYSRLRGDGVTTVDVRYEFDDDGDVEPPEWAEEPE